MERRIRKVTQDTIDAFYPNLNLAAFYRKVAEEFQMPDTGLTAREYGLRLTYINMCLCMSGPCVEKYLRENEVEVEEDWICKIGQDSGK